MRESFEARSWHQQWKAVLEKYLDWEIGRRTEWPWREAEVSVEETLTDKLCIGGRIDRLDRNSDGAALLDYKTGKPPAEQQVHDGEAVQLPSYAMAVPEVKQLDYLKIEKDKVTPTTCADAETLEALLPALRERLATLNSRLHQQAHLPAWGDDATCTWCEFDGVCRRALWQQQESDSD
jgi:ATP-dependent helicase/nuclease subunit B